MTHMTPGPVSTLRNHTTQDAASTQTTTIVTTTGGPRLVAVDVDGTVVSEGTMDVPPAIADAVQNVVAAGHHVSVATGRSLVGALPVAAGLGLTSGWIVASNGAVTARLAPNLPDGYEVVDSFVFDTARVVRLVRELRPETSIAVESIGRGYYVTHAFPRGTLNGRQLLVPDDELPSSTPRMVLRAPGVTTALLDHVQALGLTTTAATDDWTDVTPPLLSKGTALNAVRRRLGVSYDDTVMIGDGVNDLPGFKWAAISVAMGHAPAAVRHAADITTGTLEQHGAATILEAIAAGTFVAR
ncbi:HAD family hydrolase [Myceligenerans halotolerans]